MSQNVLSERPGRMRERLIAALIPDTVGLAEAIGRSLRRLIGGTRNASKARRNHVLCADRNLVLRLLARHHTRLNPPRMRRFPGLKVAKRWLAAPSTVRRDLKRMLDPDGRYESSTQRARKRSR